MWIVGTFGLCCNTLGKALQDKSPFRPENVQIIGKLGSGAQGTVYSCYLEGWICAMKEVQHFGRGSNNSSEIDILSSLPPHPNVIRYFCHRQSPDYTQLFLQQYSCTLSDIIQGRRAANAPFSPREILVALVDIAAGMKFLHSNKIIHRGMLSQVRSKRWTDASSKI